MDFQDFNDDEELKALEKASADQKNMKGYLGALGAVADNFQSIPGSHELLWGGKGRAPTASKALGAVTAQMEDPLERKQKAFEYLKSKRAETEGRDKDAYTQALKDPNSTQSKALKAMASKYVPVTAEMSGYDVQQLLDPKKMNEAEATAKINFENQKALKAMDLASDLKKLQAQNSSPKKQFENLPEDRQLTVSELSKKNAMKKSIKNQIDAVMADWDNLSDDQKVATGRSLLKTLNSTEGADAIGAEEAKRLGAKLEFAMGNLFNSNPIQFGRDLKGFKEQANNTSSAIGRAVEANQRLIDEAYGRTPGQPVMQTAKPALAPKDQKAIEWALNNQGDPRAAQILKLHGVDSETAVGSR